MYLKNLRFRECAVIIFIILGLLAFVFEKQLSPKIYESMGEAEGYSGTVSVSIKTYKKGSEIRIKEITFDHTDSEEVAEPAIDQLIDSVLTKQSADIDIVVGATLTSTAFKEALKSAIENIK